MNPDEAERRIGTSHAIQPRHRRNYYNLIFWPTRSHPIKIQFTSKFSHLVEIRTGSLVCFADLGNTNSQISLNMTEQLVDSGKVLKMTEFSRLAVK